jgi:hypothetical protein
MRALRFIASAISRRRRPHHASAAGIVAQNPDDSKEGEGMSYCRWSSDDYRCDLYCYEDVSVGWTTHVAARRVVGDIPKLVFEKLESDPGAFAASYEAQAKFLDTAEYADIGGPFDGESFNDSTLRAFRERIVRLRAAGYHCPDSVLDEIDAEIKELNAATESK